MAFEHDCRIGDFIAHEVIVILSASLGREAAAYVETAGFLQKTLRNAFSLLEKIDKNMTDMYEAEVKEEICRLYSADPGKSQSRFGGAS